MKKIISKLTAVILLICMIAGNIPAAVVYGTEIGQAGSGQTTVSDENGGNAEPEGQMKTEEDSSIIQNNDENETQTSGNETAGVSEETAESESENGAVQSEEEEQSTEDLAEESDTYSEEQNNIHYIYIERPYLETPGTQRIVFSFENAFADYEGISITVMNSEGAQEDWAVSRNVDNLYLFEKEFDDETSTGVYRVVSFNIDRGGEIDRIDVDAIETEAQFGVNQEYQGIDELAPIDEEQAEEAADVDASVVTIDENGVTEAQDSIASALEEAGASTPTTFSDISGRSSDIVVALDPGHDSTHAGASAFGLREEDLTLKIANYCKEELETYAGVSVFMTRTNSACPHPGGSSGSDIAERAAAAAAAGAKIYVSFHLNSSTASSAAGAEVIIPNNNWKPQVGQDGRALAEQIMAELTKLGLADRGIYSKDTTINERYPDNSLSDYFAVQIYNKENGIPGIIVEHAFISNSNDVNRFLASESGLKQLGAADAAGIAKYLGLLKGQWKEEDGKWIWVWEDGTESPKNEWLNILGTWYWLDENGYRVSGWKTIGGQKYYFDSEGRMTTGWKNENDIWYYFSDSGRLSVGWQSIDGYWYYFTNEGKMVTGWQKIGGQTYYFHSAGRMLTGWQKIDGSKYYFLDAGRMVTGTVTISGIIYNFSDDGKLIEKITPGWQQSENNWYYINSDGSKATGWQSIGGYWYYFTSEGKMVTGWQEIEGQTYYFHSAGRMLTGWQEINGRTYYFRISGQMVTGMTTIAGIMYEFNDVGVLIQKISPGWYQTGNTWYYILNDGWQAVGWQSIGGYWYYFDKEGKMETGWQEIGGQTYYFHSAGRMLTGWQEINGNIYYFLSAGRMVRGVVTIAGESYKFGTDGILIAKLNPGWLFIEDNWYYINTDGKSSVGWQNIGGYWYYFENDGRMVTGWQKIGGQTYYFHSAGRMLTGWQEIAGKRYYFHSAGRMLTGWQDISGNWYYFDENGVNLHEGVTSISGNSVYTKNDLIMFYNRSGYSYPSDALSKGGADNLEKFVEIYMEEASVEGIKVEVAFAQAMLETNYLQFNGDVSIEQFNFAGLGAVGNGIKGESFDNVREGIRAHIQHLKAYANTDPLVQSCVDNRFEYVRRGSAPYVEWLGIQENPYGVGWAAAENYGFNIVKLIEKM